MEEDMTKDDTTGRPHTAARIGLAAIILLWIAYAALLGFMMWTSRTGPEPGVDPRITTALAEGADRAVGVLVMAGVAIALFTIPLASMLRRSIRRR
jgi:hypothetical protein